HDRSWRNAHALRRVATERPANTADGWTLSELARFEIPRAVIARRTAASGASSARRTLLPSGAIPSSFHIEARSTPTGLSFHFAYKSLSTVVPVALSPIFKACASSQ